MKLLQKLCRHVMLVVLSLKRRKIIIVLLFLLAQHGAVVNCADLDAVGAAATAEVRQKREGLRMRYIWT